MENSLTNNNQELNGQNIPQDKAQISSSSPEENSFPQFFSVANLKKRFSTPINVNGIGSEPNRTFKRYKSERIKKFLSNKDDDNNNKKKLGTIKEIVLDDQNENMVDNNPKNRFKVKEGKKGKEEKKKKLNIIEELRNFDRKQQISMEEVYFFFLSIICFNSICFHFKYIQAFYNCSNSLNNKNSLIFFVFFHKILPKFLCFFSFFIYFF